MEVKSILDKLRQQEKKEYFFALQVEQGLVKAAIWTTEEGKVKILAVGELQKWMNEEDFLRAIDLTLSSAEEKLAASDMNLELKKVIFGVAPDWVIEDKILPEKLEVLKKVSKELGLTPVGFVITPEAIVHHLKILEGIPLNAILAGIREKKLVVTLVKLGKIVCSKLIDRSESLGADIIEGLSRFSFQEAFPSRILLYNLSSQLEKERQELIEYPWMKSEVDFLHLPKVEILPADFDIQAIALAGGKEIFQAEKVMPARVEKEQTDLIGFLKGGDIIQEKPQPTETIEKKEMLTASKIAIPKINFALVFGFFSKLKAKLFSVGEIFSQRSYLVVGLVLGVFLIGGGLIFALWWYLPQAEITLWAKSQVLEKELMLKLDPSLKIIDRENLILPAEKIETISEGEKIIETTGTKLVGEPAKGEVTIYNGTSNEKTFKKETKIVSPTGLEFVLNDDVIVASQSSAADPPGKSTVKVTAVKVGSEGNLASGTEFSIANFSKSDYVAKNDTAFTGGTSREIQVVSQKDQERLLTELVDELKKKAADQLELKLSSGKKLVPELITSVVTEKNYHQKIGEEADQVTLKLKLKLSGLGYSEEELKNLIKEKIQQAVPVGFEYKAEESEINLSLKEVDKKREVAIFLAHFKTNLLPLLDLESIRKNLVGKNPEIGRAYLATLPMIDSFEAKITPRFPGRFTTFPRVCKRIKIELRVR